MHHAIKSVTLQKILDFMVLRPFHEVEALLREIQESSAPVTLAGDVPPGLAVAPTVEPVQQAAPQVAPEAPVTAPQATDAVIPANVAPASLDPSEAVVAQ